MITSNLYLIESHIWIAQTICHKAKSVWSRPFLIGDEPDHVQSGNWAGLGCDFSLAEVCQSQLRVIAYRLTSCFIDALTVIGGGQRKKVAL